MECEICAKVFTRRDNLKRHQMSACIGKRMKIENNGHGSTDVFCNFCNEYITKQCYSAHLKSNAHKRQAFTIIDNGVEKIAGAFGDKIVSFRISEDRQIVDIDEFGYIIREKALNLIQAIIGVHGSIKVNMECFGVYFLATKMDTELKSFNTKNKIITTASNLYDMYGIFLEEIKQKMSEFQERDSGWSLVEIVYMEININKYNPIKGSSYIDLPFAIKAKHAVINIQNTDNACFAWAVTSALYEPKGLPQRTSSYPDYREIGLNFSGITFPVHMSNVPKFERLNNISINVYGINSYFDKSTQRMAYSIVTLYVCEQKQLRHVNLLLVTDDKGNSHYCWIKNLSRLISSQTSRNGHEKYICEGCLVHFSNETNLVRHQNDDCNKMKVILPSTMMKTNKYGNTVRENVLQFENFEKQMKLPFVVYADFEAILKPIVQEEKMKMDNNSSYTVRCYEHEPYSFAYYIKCSYDDSLSKLETYRGKNAAQIFMNKIENDVVQIYKNYLSQEKAMRPLTQSEQDAHINADYCHICEKLLMGEDKVYDHDHLTGLYRGPAHSVCNVNYKIPKFIPIFFHNLSNYDSHMFVKDIALKKEEVDVIAQNKEKYISFSKRVHVDDVTDCKGKKYKMFMKIRFVDSFRFMAASLEKLASYLQDNQCVEIRKYFSEDIKFGLIRKKGIFPYSFVDSFEKLDVEKLPDRQDFYDVLNDQHVTEENYARAQTVWNVFKCETLGEYSDIYLKSDVLMLSDIFENFRKICIQYYKLDPCHYFTAPGFGWDALLRMTGVKLDLLTDIDMLHFFKKGVRGGISMCTKRMAKANNMFLPKHDKTKPSSYILYLDATNLYGHAMRRKLPIGNFRWLTKSEIEDLSICDIEDDGYVGYVFEVDLQYPEALHKEHDQLPFCPEDMVPPGGKFRKLIPNLYDKEKYIIHYVNLKQCLRHGLKIVRIHRVLKFKQSDWMRTYIDFNTHKRDNANNEFERNHYKLMNNMVFGKTMENVENRVDIRLVTHWESHYKRAGVEALVAKPNFKSTKIFCDNLVAVEMNILEVRYNKPLYVGFAILELSKTVMYDFFYDYIKKKYENNVNLLYTDTDSLILEIKTENVYEDMKKDIDRFDTSNYSLDNIHNIPRGKSMLGKMKDEYAGNVITLFLGTGAKAYCVRLLSDLIKKAKGVKQYVIKKHLTLNDYKRVVEEGKCVYKKMYVFKSHFHTMYTELKNKIALSAHDDKRYVLKDGYHTLAWGNIAIEEIEKEEKEDEMIDKHLEMLIKAFEQD